MTEPLWPFTLTPDSPTGIALLSLAEDGTDDTDPQIRLLAHPAVRPLEARWLFTELSDAVTKGWRMRMVEPAPDGEIRGQDDEIKRLLFVILNGEHGCKTCIVAAEQVGQIQPGETCRLHGTETAGAA
jgi:hypothetical protein